MKNNVLADEKPIMNFRFSRVIRTICALLFAPIVLYYLWARGVVYFNFSREVYTDYFWYRAPWLLVHVICGLVANLIGPIQFISAFRKRYPAYHRKLGKIYLSCILISTLVSFYLVFTAKLGIVYATGLAMLGIVWLGSSGIAWYAILKGDVALHKDWMIKSYVLTLSFICFRLFEDLLAKIGVGNFIERKVLMAWACWVIPLFITIMILQLRKLNVRKKPAIEV